MSDVAPRRNSSGGSGGSWQPRGRGRGFFRGNSGGRINGNQGATRAGGSVGALPGSQSSQQVITDTMEVNQGPYSGWSLYNKQETEQRKRRSPNWGEAETLLLLRLWAERVQEMKTTKRNGFMLDEMAQLLQTNGFTRSSTEVKTRIANLSQEYRMELRKRSLGFPRGSFKLWDAVHAILGPEEGGSYIASEQQQQTSGEGWQQEQQEQNSSNQGGESAEALCCDIDPGMLMGQQDTGDEEEEEEEEYSNPLDNGFSALNGLPNVPPSLTISLTPAPSQAANGSNSIPPPSLTRMPALIRVGAKRSSQDSTPPPMPPLVRKSVGKRQRHSLDSSLLSHIKFEDPELKIEEHPLPPPPRGEIEQGPSSCGSDEGLDGGWAIVAEQLRQANNMAEIRTNNLTNLMEQQIKLQKQGLKMQKRMLSILEQMHPMQSAAVNIKNTS